MTESNLDRSTSTLGVKPGYVLVPTLFSIFMAAYISLAAVDQAKCAGIIYRTDGELLNVRSLKANTKVKATSILDLQYSDDCVIAARTEAALQNTIDGFFLKHVNFWASPST